MGSNWHTRGSVGLVTPSWLLATKSNAQAVRRQTQKFALLWGLGFSLSKKFFLLPCQNLGDSS